MIGKVLGMAKKAIGGATGAGGAGGVSARGGGGGSKALKRLMKKLSEAKSPQEALQLIERFAQKMEAKGLMNPKMAQMVSGLRQQFAGGAAAA